MTITSQISGKPAILTLTAGRWFIPVLGEMAGSGGIRTAIAIHRLGMSASMARRTLRAMEEEGWIISNPGHGHPLRPEYLLSEVGQALAPHCRDVVEARQALGEPKGGVGRWHLPLLSALGETECRFGDLETRLAPVTPRALSTALKRGVGLGHVLRDVRPSYPPLTTYRLAEKARGLAVAARPLATPIIRGTRAPRRDSLLTAFPRVG